MKISLREDFLFQTRERYNQNIVALAEFAFAMIAVLEGINRDCFNDFKLRVGMCNGPLVAGMSLSLECSSTRNISGIVGAKKPQYDIWGNTVNVASRMDSTGVVSCIHVRMKSIEEMIVEQNVLGSRRNTKGFIRKWLSM